MKISPFVFIIIRCYGNDFIPSVLRLNASVKSRERDFDKRKKRCNDKCAVVYERA